MANIFKILTLILLLTTTPLAGYSQDKRAEEQQKQVTIKNRVRR